MFSFLLSLAILISGYFVYGRYIESLIKPDSNAKTVAYTKTDGMDYIPLPSWKIFMIQFLNIAGLGPIFGAVMGAKFGVASYFWIVLGTLFAGAVHDYIAGMISLRHDGESLPESIRRYLGTSVGRVMRYLTVILLVLVGAVFVAGPAGLLAKLTAGVNPLFDVNFWVVIIFIYYIIATILPIDKVIAPIYPIFSVALLFMQVSVLGCLIFSKGWILPEFTDAEAYVLHTDGVAVFPMMFISIACGAISGFHASQSPMMARCLKNEKQGRPVFYGAMVTEGISALIWAAAATCFFHENGYGESNAAIVVDTITRSWLGTAGAVLAMLGVIFAPITSSDTALRSARLIFADLLKIDQKKISKRILVSLPIMLVTLAILLLSFQAADGFNIIWRYLSWSNQLLSVFTLWMITVYLVKNGKNFYVSLIPSLFMTAVTMTYAMTAKEVFGLPMWVGYSLSAVAILTSLTVFIRWKLKQ